MAVGSSNVKPYKNALIFSALIHTARFYYNVFFLGYQAKMTKFSEGFSISSTVKHRVGQKLPDSLKKKSLNTSRVFIIHLLK